MQDDLTKAILEAVSVGVEIRFIPRDHHELARFLEIEARKRHVDTLYSDSRHVPSWQLGGMAMTYRVRELTESVLAAIARDARKPNEVASEPSPKT